MARKGLLLSALRCVALVSLAFPSHSHNTGTSSGHSSGDMGMDMPMDGETGHSSGGTTGGHTSTDDGHSSGGGHTDGDMMMEEYDFVVVGSGPGGATVARYLSKAKKMKWKVLLLEAGPNYDSLEIIRNSSYAPGLDSNDVTAKLYYLVPSLPNPVSNGDDAYLAGRMLGGSSSLNGQQYVKPTDLVLERLFEASGYDPDWHPTKLRHNLKEIERVTDPALVTSTRGTDGPIPVRPSPRDVRGTESYELGRTLVRAFNNASLARDNITDYNHPDTPLGAFYQWQLSQYENGDRGSSSTTMLNAEARSRKNLVIRTRSTVTFVNFDGKVATGVDYLRDGMMYTVKARKAVILAAGIRSSLILENSGIGDAEHLEPLVMAAGREMVVDLPAVGEYLGNEGYVSVVINKTKETGRSANPADLYAAGGFLPYPTAGITMLRNMNATACPEIEETDRRRRLHGAAIEADNPINPLCRRLYGGGAESGHSRSRRRRLTTKDSSETSTTTTTATNEGAAEVTTTGTNAAVNPDATDLVGRRKRQHRRTHGGSSGMVMPMPSSGSMSSGHSSGGMPLPEAKTYNDEANPRARFSQIWGADGPKTFTISGIVLGVKSRGFAHIQSPDPLTWPLLNTQIFYDEHDPLYWCAFVKYQLYPLVKAMVTVDSTLKLQSPSMDVLQSDGCEKILEWVYGSYAHTHHFFGTTRMARRSDGGVVDSNGRVYGTENLMVADASVFPIKPDGNTAVPAYLMGVTIAKKIVKIFSE